MSNTYTQIYIHIIFAVRDRKPHIKIENKEEIHQNITGIIQNKNQNVISINSMPDHVHILVSVKPSITISDFVRDIKNNSSRFINKKRWIMDKFSWQQGFGAFSYGHSQIDAIDKYIQNQEHHHKHMTCKEEYIKFLQKYGVKYDEKYI